MKFTYKKRKIEPWNRPKVNENQGFSMTELI